MLKHINYVDTCKSLSYVSSSVDFCVTKIHHQIIALNNEYLYIVLKFYGPLLDYLFIYQGKLFSIENDFFNIKSKP